jgi:hypothetical protein
MQERDFVVRLKKSVSLFPLTAPRLGRAANKGHLLRNLDSFHRLPLEFVGCHETAALGSAAPAVFIQGLFF